MNPYTSRYIKAEHRSNPHRRTLINSKITTIYPAVKVKLNQPLKIDGNKTIPIGEIVLIQPLNELAYLELCNKSSPGSSQKSKQHTQDYQYKVYPFEKLKEGINPESKRDITVAKGHVLPPQSAPLNFTAIEEYKHFPNEEIFPPGCPTIEDIHQTRLPNCYFLAAVQCLLTDKENGQNFLKGMIQDNNDGTATVRLYDPKTEQPIFVRVAKARLLGERPIAGVIGSKKLNGHTALWVDLLETAYASLGYKNIHNITAPSVTATYAGGGRTEFALSILTGRKAGFEFIKAIPQVPHFLSSEKLDESASLLKDFIELIESKDTPKENKDFLALRLFQKVFAGVELTPEQNLVFNPNNVIELSGETQLTDEVRSALLCYIKLYEKHTDKIKPIIDNESLSPFDKLSKMLSFLKHHNADALLIKLFESTKKQFVPLTPFPEKYSQHALGIYEKIESNLTQGNLLGAGTHPRKVKQPIPGLAQNHAYTILGVSKEKQRIEGENREVYYIHLRNPWGKYGIEYKEKRLEKTKSAHAGDNAVFRIELNDFIQGMADISILESKNLFLQDKIIIEIQSAFEQEGPLNFSLDSEQLVEDAMRLSNAWQGLIQSQLSHLTYFNPEDIGKLLEILEKDIDSPAAHDFFESKKLPNNLPLKFDGSEKEHLVLLLKLQCLYNKNHQDLREIDNLESAIVFSTDYKISDALLKGHEQLMDLTQSQGTKQLDGLLDELDRKIEDLDKTLDEYSKINGQHDSQEKMSLSSSKIMTFKLLYQSILEKKYKLEKIGWEAPSDLQEKFSRLDEKIQPYQGTQQQFVKDDLLESHYTDIFKVIKNLTTRIGCVSYNNCVEKLKQRLEKFDELFHTSNKPQQSTEDFLFECNEHITQAFQDAKVFSREPLRELQQRFNPIYHNMKMPIPKPLPMSPGISRATLFNSNSQTSPSLREDKREDMNLRALPKKI